MKKKNLSDTFTITAHTGCEKTPQNTIESVQKAFECGADIFEIDINFDKNGTPVLSHDAPKGGEPTVEEVFRIFSENKKIRCNLDIKKTDNLKAVADLAKKYDVLDRVFYTGIHEGFVESAKTDTPEIPYYLNLGVTAKRKHTDEYIDSLVEKVKESGAVGINCNYRNVTPEIVDAFHKNGLLVSIWTIDRKWSMLKFLKMNPDNITTRKPSVLKKISK